MNPIGETADAFADILTMTCGGEMLAQNAVRSRKPQA
jgi:hypothetical protein